MIHVKRLIILVMFLFSVQLSHGFEWVFQAYFPSFTKIVSGYRDLPYQSQENVDGRFILPFEFKFSFGKLGSVGISTSAVFSYYSENDDFTSMNLSTGFGISFPGEYNSPLEALYLNIFPMYEFPIIPFGEMSVLMSELKWKIAVDVGIGFDLFSFNDMNAYISLYARPILLWYYGKEPFDVVPDAGIALGWHFR